MNERVIKNIGTKAKRGREAGVKTINRERIYVRVAGRGVRGPLLEALLNSLEKE